MSPEYEYEDILEEGSHHEYNQQWEDSELLWLDMQCNDEHDPCWNGIDQ